MTCALAARGVHVASLTEGCRGVILFVPFACISLRSLCLQVEKHFVRKHKKSPFQEFLLLDSWHHSERLSRVKSCMRTKWARHLAKSKGLSRRVLLSRLLATARRTWTNISTLEVGHGRNRKVAKRRVNAVNISAQDLSADHLGRSGSCYFCVRI